VREKVRLHKITILGALIKLWVKLMTERMNQIPMFLLQQKLCKCIYLVIPPEVQLRYAETNIFFV